MFSLNWRLSVKLVQLEETFVNSLQIGLIPWSIAQNWNTDKKNCFGRIAKGNGQIKREGAGFIHS